MSKKPLKYTDVFNNPFNDYVCPTFPTCANSNDDDFYFEFIDKQSAGIVNNKATIQSMDLSDLSSYVKSWSQDTVVIHPNKVHFIKGDEFIPQKKKIIYKENGSFPVKDVNRSYYFNVTIHMFDSISFIPVNIKIPIYKDNYDLETVFKTLQQYLDIKKIPISATYDVNNKDYDTLDMFDTDGDGYVDIWWEGEKHVNGVIIFESNTEDFKFMITKDPTVVSYNLCDAYVDEYNYIIVNDTMLDVNKLIGDASEDIYTIIQSMDVDNNKEADIYWENFDGNTSKPNNKIPSIYDKDSVGSSGYGFVDIVWDSEDDDSEGDIEAETDCTTNVKLEDSIKFLNIGENQFDKYVNGAFKGISIKFKYPKTYDAYKNPIDYPEEQLYINYKLLPETYKDESGKINFIHMDGFMYNGNKYIEHIKNTNSWDSTSLIYINVSNESQLIGGMLLYNPHPFPIGATYIKFN